MSYVKVVSGVLVALLVGWLALSWWQGRGSEAEIERLLARGDSLEAEVARRDTIIAAIDSAWAVDSSRRVAIRERSDTVFRASVDTIRAALPDSLQGALDALVRADSVEDAAYEADIRQLHARIRARDRALASRDSLLAVRDTIIGKLKEPDPFTIDLPFGLEAKPGLAVGFDTRGKPNLVAGVTVQ